MYRSDYGGSSFGDYKGLKDHYDREVSLVRMGNDYNLVKDEQENLCIEVELTRWKGEDAVNSCEKVITYSKNGDIIIDIPTKKSGYYGRHSHRMMENLLQFLPDSVAIYETQSNDKQYLMYEPDSNVRQYNYSPKIVYEISKSKSIHLKADGTVRGAKKVTRGEKKFAEKKSLQDHMEPKHFKEMTKARLNSDLEVDYTTLHATFRGQQTGTQHRAIEMYKPSVFKSYERNGPNSGLIRRLFVGRFMENDSDFDKCREIALEIIKDIPDSCLSSTFERMRDEHKET